MAIEPFMTVDGTPLNFQEDWTTLGGGLWSTGLAWAMMLADHPERFRRNLARRNEERVSFLELGSGNGLLAAAFLALAKDRFSTVVVTDTAEHLPFIQTTFEANKHICSQKEKEEPTIHIVEHQWGDFPRSPVQGDPLNRTFDLIVGSDLAYRDELHDPLIDSLLRFSGNGTTILLGVTMIDTKPIFFSKLRNAGFKYERVADHLVDPKFRGVSFGLFVIARKH